MIHTDVNVSRHLMSCRSLLLDSAKAGHGPNSPPNYSAWRSISAMAHATSAGPNCLDVMLMFLIKSSI